MKMICLLTTILITNSFAHYDEQSFSMAKQDVESAGKPNGLPTDFQKSINSDISEIHLDHDQMHHMKEKMKSGSDTSEASKTYKDIQSESDKRNALGENDFNPELHIEGWSARMSAALTEEGIDVSTHTTDHDIDDEIPCQLPAQEPITITCARNRTVVLNITPETTKTVYDSCWGHLRKDPEICDHIDMSENFYRCWDGEGCCAPKTVVDQPKIVDVASDTWSGCEELEALEDKGEADLVDETPGAENETQIIQGESVTRDVWHCERTYVIHNKAKNTCKPYLDKGCLLSGKATYAAEGTDANNCFYNTSVICKRTESTAQTRIKFDGYLPPKQTYQPNDQMYSALSQLAAMQEIAKHKSVDGQNVTIFKGDDKRCSINFGSGFKNCCKGTGGAGVRMKVATECSASEKDLQQMKKEGRCVFVGTKTKSKTLGIVTAKEQVHCCYPSKLSRAIQEGARHQISKTFGDADNPDCSGLTPDELARVDFSTLDLSEAFEDVSKNIKNGMASTQAHLQQMNNRFQKSQSRVDQESKQQHQNKQGASHEAVVF